MREESIPTLLMCSSTRLLKRWPIIVYFLIGEKKSTNILERSWNRCTQKGWKRSLKCWLITLYKEKIGSALTNTVERQVLRLFPTLPTKMLNGILKMPFLRLKIYPEKRPGLSRKLICVFTCDLHSYPWDDMKSGVNGYVVLNCWPGKSRMMRGFPMSSTFFQVCTGCTVTLQKELPQTDKIPPKSSKAINWSGCISKVWFGQFSSCLVTESSCAWHGRAW